MQLPSQETMPHGEFGGKKLLRWTPWALRSAVRLASRTGANGQDASA